MRLNEINIHTKPNMDSLTLINWTNGVIVPRMLLVKTNQMHGQLTLSYRNQITRDLATIVIDIRNQTMFDPDGFPGDMASYADEKSFKEALAQMVKSAEDIE